MQVSMIGLDLAKSVFQAHGRRCWWQGCCLETASARPSDRLLREAAAVSGRDGGLRDSASLGPGADEARHTVRLMPASYYAKDKDGKATGYRRFIATAGAQGIVLIDDGSNPSWFPGEVLPTGGKQDMEATWKRFCPGKGQSYAVVEPSPPTEGGSISPALEFE